MSRNRTKKPDSELTPQERTARRNGKVALICAAAFFGMIGAAYAAVPLYKLFCQATGFDGTVRKAQAAPTTILARKVTIRFDANIRELPWQFQTLQASQDIRIGDTGLAFFKVTNPTDKPQTGRALYNVVPESAGPYFQKLECFCFSSQTIQPHQTVEFPVVYFVDPKFADDPETKGKNEITLSYTFFPAVDDGKAGPAGAAGKTKKADVAAATTPRIVEPLGGAPSRGL
uniref:cytochrome c oxidase assembly protein n=1 Tax=uncultured Caulobacter sp. TaxID=158749 RepID=UPI0025FC2DC2|nr:cytochrome c oxidase assembly protein [uncultured Caulobacter sp.]